ADGRTPLHRGHRAGNRLLRPEPLRRGRAAEALLAGAAADGLSSRALRLRRMFEPRGAIERPLFRARRDGGDRLARHTRPMAEARWVVSRSAPPSRLGQRAYASLGSGADVQKSRLRLRELQELILMCGICGQFNFATGAPVASRDVE